MNSVFAGYARYYDLLYRDKDYAAESEYVASFMRERLPRAGRILELGCGTGIHACHLAGMGYTVDGVDVSKQMVEAAQARRNSLSPEVAGRVTFSEADVRSLRVDHSYDAVISLFHVVSYQTTNSDLDAIFATASAHLSDGGLFLFDFWYGPAVLTQQPDTRVKRLEDEETRVTRIAEPLMRVNENVVDVNYQVFVEDKASAKVEQVKEVHSMRYLFLPELERYAATGLALLDVNAWMTRRPLDKDDWSGFACMIRRGHMST